MHTTVQIVLALNSRDLGVNPDTVHTMASEEGAEKQNVGLEGVLVRLPIDNTVKRSRPSSSSHTSHDSVGKMAVAPRKRKRQESLELAGNLSTNSQSAMESRAPSPLPKGTIPGFPRKNTPLPDLIEDADLIKNYPNHLHGEVLLRISEKGWSVKEIVEWAGCPQLRPNTLTKRIQAARMKRDGVRPARPRKRMRPSQDTEKILPPPFIPWERAQLEPIESEAGRKFRLEQTEIRAIVMQMKPDIFAAKRTKRTASDNRIIFEKAVEEYKKRIAQFLL